MLEDLTAQQISEWEAFNTIQPLGHKRMDFYFAYIMSTMHNIALGFAGAKGKEFKAEEFTPNWSGQEREPDAMPVSEMKQFFMEFAEKHNKQVMEQKEIIKKRK